MKIVINKKDQISVNSGAALAIKKLTSIKYVLGLSTKALKNKLRRPKDNTNGSAFLRIIRSRKARENLRNQQKDKVSS